MTEFDTEMGFYRRDPGRIFTVQTTFTSVYQHSVGPLLAPLPSN